RCDEEHTVHAVLLGGGDPVGALVGDEVGGDQPGAAGGGEVAGEGVGPVGEHRVPVAHHEDRGAATGELLDGLQDVPGAGAALERGGGGLLDHGAVHDGVGVGQAQLDHVRAVVDEHLRGLDRAVEVGISDGQVA